MKNIPNSEHRKRITIANGTSYSEPIDNTRVGLRGFGVCMDGGWTAARIGVQVTDGNPEDTGVVWRDLRDDTGALIAISGIATSADPALYSCPGEVWQVGAWPWFRLMSINTASEAAVNQGSERTMIVSMVY